MGITPSSLASVANSVSTAQNAGISAEQDFGGVLNSAIQEVNNLQSSAEQQVTGLLAGNGTDVHSAALSVERASLAFDLMLQVRNKVVSAYQEISRLQF